MKYFVTKVLFLATSLIVKVFNPQFAITKNKLEKANAKENFPNPILPKQRAMYAVKIKEVNTPTMYEKYK